MVDTFYQCIRGWLEPSSNVLESSISWLGLTVIVLETFISYLGPYILCNQNISDGHWLALSIIEF